jgi:hypothetical protein
VLFLEQHALEHGSGKTRSRLSPADDATFGQSGLRFWGGYRKSLCRSPLRRCSQPVCPPGISTDRQCQLALRDRPQYRAISFAVVVRTHCRFPISLRTISTFYANLHHQKLLKICSFLACHGSSLAAAARLRPRLDEGR